MALDHQVGGPSPTAGTAAAAAPPRIRRALAVPLDANDTGGAAASAAMAAVRLAPAPVATVTGAAFTAPPAVPVREESSVTGRLFRPDAWRRQPQAAAGDGDGPDARATARARAAEAAEAILTGGLAVAAAEGRIVRPGRTTAQHRAKQGRWPLMTAAAFAGAVLVSVPFVHNNSRHDKVDYEGAAGRPVTVAGEGQGRGSAPGPDGYASENPQQEQPRDTGPLVPESTPPGSGTAAGEPRTFATGPVGADRNASGADPATEGPDHEGVHPKGAGRTEGAADARTPGDDLAGGHQQHRTPDTSAPHAKSALVGGGSAGTAHGLAGTGIAPEHGTGRAAPDDDRDRRNRATDHHATDRRATDTTTGESPAHTVSTFAVKTPDPRSGPASTSASTSASASPSESRSSTASVRATPLVTLAARTPAASESPAKGEGVPAKDTARAFTTGDTVKATPAVKPADIGKTADTGKAADTGRTTAVDEESGAASARTGLRDPQPATTGTTSVTGGSTGTTAATPERTAEAQQAPAEGHPAAAPVDGGAPAHPHTPHAGAWVHARPPAHPPVRQAPPTRTPYGVSSAAGSNAEPSTTAIENAGRSSGPPPPATPATGTDTTDTAGTDTGTTDTTATDTTASGTSADTATADATAPETDADTDPASPGDCG
ncbi:hypothetical protein KUM39_11060 [Streptomyces sp. J2-1]|uniref:hypothetical protein n=1 Tax=Streptomyces corallincola TaxID=2851888 RepID=UPI001C3918E7|nr:hypothetical protein [Streptomyces corallincola]MBV2354899.1 hypothetical protein [Streptomyces corallincola]